MQGPGFCAHFRGEILQTRRALLSCFLLLCKGTPTCLAWVPFIYGRRVHDAEERRRSCLYVKELCILYRQ